VDSFTPINSDPGWPSRPPARSRAGIAIGLLVAIPLIIAISAIALASSSTTRSAVAIRNEGPFVANPSDPADPHNANSHWHAALGVYDCDHWMGDGTGNGIWNWPGVANGAPGRVGTNMYAGLHSHDDGVIHMEPASPDEAGANATLGRYFEFGGWRLSEDSFTFLGVTRGSSNVCGNAKARLQWSVNGKSQAGNPASYKLHNDDVIVVAFISEGRALASVGAPPSAANLPDSRKNEGGTSGASAAGKPCVAEKGPSPRGAPAVAVVPGPPPSRLIVKDLKVGTGPVVKAGATLTVNYIGVACSTGKIFDSSYSRGTPATFPLSGIILGWQKGVPGMRVGGVRLLAIPPQDAYGTAGSPPVIAPDETLWFVVTVVKLG
jgi:peptidylprolyl isomerase